LQKEDIRWQKYFQDEGQLWRVLEYQHIKVARGGATIRLKLRNLRSGSTVEKTFNNGSRVDDVRLDSRTVQFLYKDDHLSHFMDTETYEQIALSPDTLEGVSDFIKDNTMVEIESFEGEPLNVSLPTTVDLAVVWAEMAIAGDTANSPTKQVELETGYKMSVPMFVKEGDTIRVDTRTGAYVTRVQ
jgi:elongation factor P